MAGDLLYMNEHLSCQHNVVDYRCRFKYREEKAGTCFNYDNEPFSILIFGLSGEAVVSCNEYRNRIFKAGEIIFVPKGSVMSCKTLTASSAVTCIFDSVKSVCVNLSLHSYWPLCRETDYDFEHAEIRPQLLSFLESLKYYLCEGVNCEHFHELKLQEIFLIFRWFYPKEELAKLFYPIIGENIDFRSFVLENFLKVKDVQGLAELSHMGRTQFDVVFKKEFGMPAGQWMLKETAKHVKYHLSKPGATVKDVMFKFNFNSSTHFTRFCKQQFGCTPTKLMSDNTPRYNHGVIVSRAVGRL